MTDTVKEVPNSNVLREVTGEVVTGISASDFDGDKISGVESTVEPIPPGSRSVEICNADANAIVRFRFGTDNKVIATSSTGFRLKPGETKSIPLSVNTNVGKTPHWAHISDLANTVLTVIWGG